MSTFTLGGDDRAFGGTGNDRFFLLGGNDVVTGGEGEDQFWIAVIAHRNKESVLTT